MSNNNNSDYLESVHKLGRWGSIGALGFMLGIPLFISAVYDIWPNIGNVLKVSVGLLTLFVPLAISEVLSYMPTLGSASYISYITGNVLNLKLPCAINAMQLADADQGTEKGDVIATIAVASSSIATMIIIALGVLLLVPLQPLFENESVQIATTYMLPALFGGMFTPMLLNNSVGEFNVKNRLLPIVLPMVIIFIIHTFIFPLNGFEGIALVVVIPVTVLIARFLYNKGIIKMTPKDE